MKLPDTYDFVEMHDELAHALDIIQNTDDNLCVIGSAGSGKTLLITMLSDKRVYNHNTVVVTPTGISAINASTENVRACTIHSLFRLPPMSIIPDDKLETYAQLVTMFNNLHTIIIDEISMVNSDLLTKIHHLLLRYRRNTPVRFIIIGDPSQLSPIIPTADEMSYITDMYGSPFFFSSPLFQEMKVVHFTKIFRQYDTAFSEVLNRMRFDEMTLSDKKFINSRVMDIDEFKKGGDFIYVALTNRTVNAINDKALKMNTCPTRIYNGVNTYFRTQDMPVPEQLVLKMSTQVMICANNNQKGYYNGLLGRITDLKPDSIQVTTNRGVYDVDPYTWQKYTYEYNAVTREIQARETGNYKQFPIKVAYALTSHKTQGLTLDRAYIDLERRTFSSGMAYTALSRTRRLEDMGLARRLTDKDIKLSKSVKKFYKEYNISYTRKQEV
jgi:ATP-dependent DNA helicase PIF1